MTAEPVPDPALIAGSGEGLATDLECLRDMLVGSAEDGGYGFFLDTPIAVP